jgi:hypothetical protein
LCPKFGSYAVLLRQLQRLPTILSKIDAEADILKQPARDFTVDRLVFGEQHAVAEPGEGAVRVAGQGNQFLLVEQPLVESLFGIDPIDPSKDLEVVPLNIERDLMEAIAYAKTKEEKEALRKELNEIKALRRDLETALR